MTKNPPLTKQKRKWAKGRDVALRGQQLNYNAAQQMRYSSALEQLVTDMVFEVRQEIRKLFRGPVAKEFFKSQKEAAAMDASLASQARILTNALLAKFNKLFKLKSQYIVDRMIGATLKLSKTNLHSSLQQLSGGLSLKTGIVPAGAEETIKAIIAENVSLIKTVPELYLKNVTGAVMRSITTGQGLLTLIPEIDKYSGQTRRHVRNLALDQTRKAYNSINKQRMQAVGVKQFEWVHSGGGREPRKSHVAMSGNIYSFDNLPIINQEQVAKGYESPQRGIPGQAINCKCTMIPVIKFDEGE